MLTEFITKNKSHIIYGALILAGLGVAYTLLNRKPKEIIKTEVKTVEVIKIVNKDVIKIKKVYVDRTTTIHKKNGDVIVVVDKSHSDSSSVDKTKTAQENVTIVSKQVTEKFMSSYSLDVMFPIVKQSLSINANPLDTEFIVGIRVFSLPVFVTTGTNAHLNEVLVGLRLEF